MDNPQEKISLPSSQENSTISAIPGIAICGLLTVGIISTLSSVIGFFSSFLAGGSKSRPGWSTLGFRNDIDGGRSRKLCISGPCQLSEMISVILREEADQNWTQRSKPDCAVTSWEQRLKIQCVFLIPGRGVS